MELMSFVPGTEDLLIPPNIYASFSEILLLYFLYVRYCKWLSKYLYIY